MAEFCKQCADEIGFPNDLAGITTDADVADGKYAVVLCEGCGITQVDPLGKCMTNCDLHHVTVMS